MHVVSSTMGLALGRAADARVGTKNLQNCPLQTIVGIIVGRPFDRRLLLLLAAAAFLVVSFSPGLSSSSSFCGAIGLTEGNTKWSTKSSTSIAELLDS